MITRYLKSPLWYGVGDSIVGQVRKANEDSCGYQSTPNGELFVVCDGMGGHVGGATASRIAVESIISYLSQQAWSNKPKAIEDALRFANTQILGTAANDPSLKGMGTTACIVLCEEQNVWIGHVGDSRIYLFVHKDKSLQRITKDHSYVQVLVDKGEIDDRQAENHPQKNIIMRALGSKEDVIPEVEQMPVQVTRGDTFLICSDGLSGMIDDNEIEKILTSDISLEDKAEKLINDANAPGKGKDNITVQLVQAMNDNPKATVFPDFNPQWRKRKPNQGHGKMIALIVSASCVFLTMIIAGGLLLFRNSNKGHEEGGINITVETGQGSTVEEISTEDLFTVSDIIATGGEDDKTILEIEEDATNLLNKIKNYESSINSSKDKISGYWRIVSTSSGDLDNKDTTQLQVTLSNAQEKKRIATISMNELNDYLTKTQESCRLLAQTKVNDKIEEARKIYIQCIDSQKKANSYIDKINNDIQNVQERLKTKKEKDAKEALSTPLGNTTDTLHKDTLNKQSMEIKTDTLKGNRSLSNKDAGQDSAITDIKNDSIRKGPKVGMQFLMTDLFSDLPSDYYFYDWTSSDESLAEIIKYFEKRTVSVKGIKEGVVTITGKPKSRKNTNIYSITLQIRPQK